MELQPFDYEIWSTRQGSYILAPVVSRHEDKGSSGTCLVSTIELQEFGDLAEAQKALKVAGRPVAATAN